MTESTETFGTKLRQMRRDLRSIATRMLMDGQPESAKQAIEAMQAVDNIEPDDLDWSWQPDVGEDE